MHRFVTLLGLFPALSLAQSTPAAVSDLFPPAGAINVARNTLIFHNQLYDGAVTTLRPAGGPPGSEVPLVRFMPPIPRFNPVLRPATPLAPNTRYELTIQVRPNQAPQSFTFTFTTGAEVDTTPPYLVSVSPDPGKISDPSVPIALRFSEPILVSSAAEQGTGWDVLTLLGTANSYPPSLRLSEDRTTVILTPHPSSRVLQLTLLAGAISDTSGNAGAEPAPPPFRFHRLIAPTDFRLLNRYPENGQTNIPTNVPLQLLFNRKLPLDGSQLFSGTSAIRINDGTRDLDTVTASFGDFRGLIVTPTGGWTPNSRHTVTVSATVFDGSGTPLGIDQTFEFSTAGGPAQRITPPLAGYSPVTWPQIGPAVTADPAAPTDARIVLRSANPLPPFVGEYFSLNSDLAVQATLAEDTRTLTLTPSRDLPVGIITLNFTPIIDIFGMEVASSFSLALAPRATADELTVTATSPQDGAGRVHPSAVIRITANHLLSLDQPGNGIRITRGGDPVPGRWSIERGATLAFTPTPSLEADTDYVLAVDAITDVSGARASGPTIRFRTSPIGFPPPTRADETVSPSATTPLGLRQSILVTPGVLDGLAGISCTVTAKKKLSARQELWIDVELNVAWDGTILRIDPREMWPADMLLEFSCRYLDFIRSRTPITRTFSSESGTFEGSPTLISAEPPPGSDLLPGTLVRLRFSEPLMDNSDTLPGLSNGNCGRLVWSSDRRIASFNVSAIATDCTIVPSDSLTNFNGQSIAPFVLSFGISRSGPNQPSIRRVIPEAQRPLEDLESAITLIYSAPVSLARLRTSFRVYANVEWIPGEWSSVTGEPEDTIFIFRPARPYPPSSFVFVWDHERGSDTIAAFSTAAAPVPASAQIKRCTVGPIPANAVFDCELSVEPSAVPFSPRLVRYASPNSTETLIARWERVRPRVFRLVPATPLAPGNYAVIPDANWPAPSYSPPLPTRIPFTVTAAVTGTRPNVSAVVPPRNFTGVPINANLGAAFEELINPFTLQPDTVSIRVGGVPVKSTVAVAGAGYVLTVNPALPFPANAEVDIQIAGLQDRLGRPFGDLRWAFKTGRYYDETPPVLLSGPTKNSSSAALVATADASKPLRFVFNEPINPLPLLLAPITEATSSTRRITPVFSPDLTTVLLQPSLDWPRGETIFLQVPFSDMAGNTCNSDPCFIRQLRFLLDPDTTAPVLESVSVPDGTDGVPLNPFFDFGFDSPVDSFGFQQIQLFEGDSPVTLRNAAYSSMPLSVLRVAPVGLLKPRSRYTIRIEGVTDPSGNVMAGAASYSFTTGSFPDITSPEVIFAERVPVGGPLRFRFSEPMSFVIAQRSAGAILTASDPGTVATLIRPVPARLVISDDRREATIFPEKPLPVGLYRIDLSAASDMAGRGAAGVSNRTIEVSDDADAAPISLSLFPPDGAANVPTNVVAALASSPRPPASYRVRMWEDERPYPGVIADRTLIRFTQPLKPNTRYRLEVTDIVDLYGFSIDPLTSTFSTANAAERSNLPLLRFSPTDGATGISPYSPITVTFGRNLHPASTFYSSTAISSPSIIGIIRPDFQISGSAVTFTTQPFLPPAAQVTLNMDGYAGGSDLLGGPIDVAGNRPNRQISTSFRTAALNDPTPLRIDSQIPPAGEKLPALRDARITVVFSKPVLIAPNSTSVLVNGLQRSGDCTLSLSDYRTCVFTLQLSPFADVKVLLTSGVRDFSGNALDPVTLDYKVGESIPSGPPQVNLVEPQPFAQAASTAQPLIQFDRRMDPASVSAGLRVTQNGAIVDGSLSAENENRAFRFRPSVPLAAGARISVILANTVQDAEGRFLGEWKIFTFGIRQPAGTLSLIKASVLSVLPANAPIDLTFASPVYPESVNTDTIWLTSGGRLVPVRVSISAPEVVRIEPESPLVPGETYILTIGSAVRGLTGAFPGTGIHFLAGAPASPSVTSVEPTSWLGQPAFRYEFSAPITPAEAAAVGDGAAAISPDGRSIILTRPARLRPGSLVPRIH